MKRILSNKIFRPTLFMKIQSVLPALLILVVIRMMMFQNQIPVGQQRPVNVVTPMETARQADCYDMNLSPAFLTTPLLGNADASPWETDDDEPQYRYPNAPYPASSMAGGVMGPVAQCALQYGPR